MLPRTIGAPVARPTAQKKSRNPYIYALDPIRVFTALSVLSVHVIGFSAVLNTSALGYAVQLGAGSALHFTREVFMFTTAFVLVYTYAGSDFKLAAYLRKRGVTVLVPYLLWSVFYVAFTAWMGGVSLSPTRFAMTTLKAIPTGSASYQLYYILLTLQFYAIFPLLLRLLPWIRRHVRLVLATSLALELVVLALDFVFVENLHAPSVFPPGWAIRIDSYLPSFVLTYQFYFILGAVAALHFDRVSAFLLAHGRAIVAAFALALGAYWFNFALSVWVGHNTADYAIAVLQPEMVPYSVVVLAFLGYLACRWAPPARPGEAPAKPRGARTWHTLADATFGVYLVHPVFLTPALTYVAPTLPAALPIPVRVALILVPVAALSVGVSVLLLRTPGLSALVGRPSPWPSLDGLRSSLAAVWGRLAAHPADAHPLAQTSGHLLAVQGAGQSAVRMPVPAPGIARSRTTLPPASRAGVTGPRRPSLATDVSDGVWADARNRMPSGAGESGGWDMLRGPHDGARGGSWTGPHAARPRSDDADVSIPGQYPTRPPSMQGDRQQRIRRAQQLRGEGWRQREIADELGVSRSTISHWLTRASAGRDGMGVRDAADEPPGSAAQGAVGGTGEINGRAAVSGDLRAHSRGNPSVGEGA
jgi:peptidoglycan/LPS O-acetylase OafA/YrhL